MKTLKGWITTTCLAAILMVSATAAKADGVIIFGATAPAPCTSPSVKTKADFGAVIAGVTGVIIYGFTGVIITGLGSAPVENCGVIITG